MSFTNLSLNKRLIFGFLVVSFMVAIAGGFGINGLKKVARQTQMITMEQIPLMNAAKEMVGSFNESQSLLRKYLLTKDKQALPAIEENFYNALGQMELYADAILKGSEELKVVAAKDSRIIQVAEKSLKLQDEFIQGAQAAMEHHGQMIYGTGGHQGHPQGAAETQSHAGATEPPRGKTEVRDHMSEAIAFDSKAEGLFHEVHRAIKEVDKAIGESVKAAERSIESTMTILVVTTLVALLLAIVFGLLISRSITKPINRIIEGLNEGAAQVASASGQVSSASQGLAEGSSEQAASIEETSSSLEEMSSMTKQNADNAQQADNLMKEANQVVAKANDSMAELTHSMEEIAEASEETSKIIKTIDEIAFQTNLLALNAAVEAARAGEAGAGFAVVADEVRNLAMRAADAARNTADLIEGTVKKVNDGGDLVATTNEDFTEVATSAAKVGELVGEIAAASNEQAEGIEQVNKAVVEMDKVVQQNAANAEESASASEEMNAQAVQMKGFVEDLVALVGGSASAGQRVSQVQVRAPKAVTTTRALAAPTPKAPPVHQAKEVGPEQVIPMSDEDFKDF